MPVPVPVPTMRPLLASFGVLPDAQDTFASAKHTALLNAHFVLRPVARSDGVDHVALALLEAAAQLYERRPVMTRALFDETLAYWRSTLKTHFYRLDIAQRAALGLAPLGDDVDGDDAIAASDTPSDDSDATGRAPDASMLPVGYVHGLFHARTKTLVGVFSYQKLQVTEPAPSLAATSLPATTTTTTTTALVRYEYCVQRLAIAPSRHLDVVDASFPARYVLAYFEQFVAQRRASSTQTAIVVGARRDTRLYEVLAAARYRPVRDQTDALRLELFGDARALCMAKRHTAQNTYPLF